eukprot:TRINITY_DN180_c0_g1_i1.p1 TRINITY_DN180_c0_g1~~TRINITY_DN180_c0_g1_i1.p1  ORF type:complete len:280 (-),score=28.58 TRINITY_DN180_c0_g1_i1:99-884(-)
MWASLDALQNSFRMRVSRTSSTHLTPTGDGFVDEDAELQRALFESQLENGLLPPLHEPTLGLGEPHFDGGMLTPEDVMDLAVESFKRDQNIKEADSRRKLREEQELEYFKGLARDQENERKKKEEEKKKLAEAEEAERKKEEEEDKKDLEEARELSKKLHKDKNLREMKESLPAEPPDSTGMSISVKLSDGRRANRRFHPTDVVGIVRNWVMTLALDGFAVPEKFALIADYPKRTFEDDSKQLRDLGLEKRALLLVEEIEA